MIWIISCICQQRLFNIFNGFYSLNKKRVLTFFYSWGQQIQPSVALSVSVSVSLSLYLALCLSSCLCISLCLPVSLCLSQVLKFLFGDILLLICMDLRKEMYAYSYMHGDKSLKSLGLRLYQSGIAWMTSIYILTSNWPHYIHSNWLLTMKP